MVLYVVEMIMSMHEIVTGIMLKQKKCSPIKAGAESGQSRSYTNFCNSQRFIWKLFSVPYIANIEVVGKLPVAKAES